MVPNTVSFLVVMVGLDAMPTVARIAYLTADGAVNYQPPLPAASAFSETFSSLSASSPHKANIISVPHGADASSSIVRYTTSLTSFTAFANLQLSTRLLAQAAEISKLPVVLHLAVRDDLSDVLLLRAAIPFFLLSTTLQQAHDNALLAARLARTERRAVVHVFYETMDAAEINETSEDEIISFVLNPRIPAANGGDLTPRKGYTNGHANGHANGRPNGRANGHSNGHANGYTNGHSPEATVDDPAITSLHQAYEAAAFEMASLVRRPVKFYDVHGSAEPHTIIITLGKGNVPNVKGVAVISVALASPMPHSHLIKSIPSSVSRVIVLEQIYRWQAKWTPIYFEVVTALQSRQHAQDFVVLSGTLGDLSNVQVVDVLKFLDQISTSTSERLLLGSLPQATSSISTTPLHVPDYEAAYTKVLSDLFGDRLEIVNSPDLVDGSRRQIATTPEFALGRLRGQVDAEKQLVKSVQELLESGDLDAELHSLLSKWVLAKDDATESRLLGNAVIQTLESGHLPHPAAQRVLALREHLFARSRWVIGSDAWSYDIGSSGLHHTIASGLNVNILILDTIPYSSRNTVDPHRRKQDVGLYGMNHGDVYVASVAVFSSYAQVLQAFVEADRFNGTSVIVGYLPYKSEHVAALELLKETKLAVDSGYWPLYRWDPFKEAVGQEPFSLDSEAIKNDLKQFLDRQNHLSQLVRSTPKMAAELVSSLGESVKEARKKRAQEVYQRLLDSLDALPLLVLYASDGGGAEKKAKRLAGRAKMRGLSTTVASLDSYTLEGLIEEEYVAFVISSAGQGEPPQNGRTFFKALNAAVLKGDPIFTKLKFSVFGMGDSQYWPRLEDAHFHNRPGRELDARLEKLGGIRMSPLGLGDDRAADGAETGYKIWEPQLWKALKVDSVDVSAEAEPQPITNEHIKAASGHLRGTIVESFQDTSTSGLTAITDAQLTKFHGVYQQDDRDLREEREAQGVEPAFMFMIRVRLPGGVCTPQQWLQMDRIADEHGSGTFKITTRQTFQFHGVLKKHVKPAIQSINRVLLDTLAVCGDVISNVVCSSLPTLPKIHQRVHQFARQISNHLLPRTHAYHEIWLDKKLVAGGPEEIEPIYGNFYLPRKFKVAIAVPPTNDVDVFADDIGFIAIVREEDGELEGFDVLIGGGMGMSHGNLKTYPRVGSLIGFCTVEQGVQVAEKIMLVQRDFGNRADRKLARVRHTVDRIGLDVFKSKLEELLGYALSPPRPFKFDRNIDDFGWHTSLHSTATSSTSKLIEFKHHCVLYIENGRIQDQPRTSSFVKTGLREIAKIHKGTFRLTANQHLIISDVDDEDVGAVKEVLKKFQLDNLEYSGLRLASSACVAFPTCGMAMAESERYLPVLIDKVEKICEENGLRNDSIVIRMTGCPNGCSRPYLAEIGFVGKSLGTYMMLLGGGYYGQRLNKIYRQSVTEPEILVILRPMIRRYALERLEGERFGDWTVRAGYIAGCVEGKGWYEGVGGEGVWREVQVIV